MSSYGLKKMYIVSKNGVLNSLIYWRNAVKAIYQERFASNLKFKKIITVANEDIENGQLRYISLKFVLKKVINIKLPFKQNITF